MDTERNIENRNRDTERPSAPNTIFTLPEQTSAMALAAACREAAMTFMNDSKEWGKLDFSVWLQAAYARTTEFAFELSLEKEGPTARTTLATSGVSPSNLDLDLTDARKDVLRILKAFVIEQNGIGFAQTMLAAGAVVECEDRDGNKAWMPVDVPGMSLADRVLSLFAADCLARPEEYEGFLCVCERCNTVVFDAIARARMMCQRHVSGMYLRPAGRPDLVPVEIA